MPIRFINYLHLNCGCKALLILSVLFATSCDFIYKDQINNTQFIIDSDGKTIQGWNVKGAKSEEIFKPYYIKEDSVFRSLISGNEKSAAYLEQKVSIAAGEYYILGEFSVDIQEGVFFVNVIPLKESTEEKSIDIIADESICERTLFTIKINERQDVIFQIGFEKGALGEALLKGLFIHKVEYNLGAKGTRDEIAKKFNIMNLFPEIDSHKINASQIDSVVRLVNKGLTGEIDGILDVFGTEAFNYESTSYLNKYMKEKGRSSYCQKSSLSVDEILKLYDLKVRQIHWQKDCSGVHQFLEYYNPINREWEIVDPFYGVRYIDKQGNYLNFEKIEKLVRKKEFSEENVLKIDVAAPFYNLEEIVNGWYNYGLAIHIIQK